MIETLSAQVKVRVLPSELERAKEWAEREGKPVAFLVRRSFRDALAYSEYEQRRLVEEDVLEQLEPQRKAAS